MKGDEPCGTPAAGHLLDASVHPTSSFRKRLAAREHGPNTHLAAARDTLLQFDNLWEQIFPAEQARIVQLVVERVTVSMVKALARGFRWRKLIETGVYASVADIAAAEKIMNPMSAATFA